MLIMPLRLLELDFKSFSFSSGFCLDRPRQFDSKYWEFDFFFFFQDFCFVVNRLGRWSQWIWLVSCSRQGMLTQGPSPDDKCKLNISSFLIRSHPLVCLIYAKDTMIIVLLLQMMGEIVTHICQGLGGGTESIMFFFFFYSGFMLLIIVLSWLVHDSFCVSCFVPFLLSLSLVPIIRH